MKRTTTDYTGIAACHNDRCPSHKNCLRWQMCKRCGKKRNMDKWYYETKKWYYEVKEEKGGGV